MILLGEYGVGKTTFLNQVQSITRKDNALEVSHSDYAECTLRVGPSENQATAKVILIDTAGVERYQRTLTNNYFRQADGAILVYDAADTVTFDTLQDWIELTQKTLDLTEPEQFVWCLVGNQKDRGIKVDRLRVQRRCEDLHTTLSFQTCALNGEGVMDTLSAIAEAIHAKKLGHVYVPRSVPRDLRTTTKTSSNSCPRC